MMTVDTFTAACVALAAAIAAAPLGVRLDRREWGWVYVQIFVIALIIGSLFTR
jgi:hypothetical protein